MMFSKSCVFYHGRVFFYHDGGRVGKSMEALMPDKGRLIRFRYVLMNPCRPAVCNMQCVIYRV